MKILPIVGCLECFYRQNIYGGYFCRKEEKHIKEFYYSCPDWCPLEDYKPEIKEVSKNDKDVCV